MDEAHAGVGEGAALARALKPLEIECTEHPVLSREAFVGAFADIATWLEHHDPRAKLLLLLLLLLLLAASCTGELGEGAGVPEECAVVQTDDSPYGLQFDCALVLDCGAHGKCRGGDFACTCDEGWTGLACDRCEATHAEVDGNCVVPCDPDTCEGRRCNGDPQEPACGACNRGRTGEDCSECVAGFETVGEGEFTACIPEDCTTSCATDRRCVVNDDGSQSCACRTSYATEDDGTCAALPPIENGDFTAGCTGWSLVQRSINDAIAIAEILRFPRDGGDALELHLVTDACTPTASAMTTVNTPGDITLPNASIQFRARGNEGGRMRVSTSRSSASRQVEIIGTGRTETVRVCLGAAAHRVLDFTVVNAGTCPDENTSEFFVDDVAFVSAADCIGPGL